MQDLFFWVIALVMVGLGVYTNYTNWTTYLKSRKSKEIFLQNHKGAVIEKVTPYRYLLFVLLAVLCFVFMIMLLVQDASNFTGASQWSQAALYGGLGVFAFAMIPESLMDSRVAVCDDGFMYETDYIRYKNINDIVLGNGFFKGTIMNTYGNKEVPMPKAIAKWVLPRWEEYKASRKAARKKKGRKGRNQSEA